VHTDQYPGLDTIPSIVPRLKRVAILVLSGIGLNGASLFRADFRNMKFVGADIYPVAAFISGVASQELVKISMLLD
jgi:NEDD8-activating enzyme E1 regulatory subunit